jgi:hypothetical protein
MVINVKIEAADSGDSFSPLTGSIFGVNEVRLNSIKISAGSISASFQSNIIEWLIELTRLISEAWENDFSSVKKVLLFSGERFNGHVDRYKGGTLSIFDSPSRVTQTLSLSWDDLLELHCQLYNYISRIVSQDDSSLEQLKDKHLISLPAALDQPLR